MELREWLSGLDEVRLTRLLTCRPDAIAPPWPRRLDDLAERLAHQDGTAAAKERLPLPALEVLEAAQVTSDLKRLASLLGSSPEALEPILEKLEDHALAWRAGGRLHHRETAHYPLRLGRTAAHFLLRQTSAVVVKNIATLLGLPTTGTRQENADRIIAFYHDQHRMELLLKVAPEGVPELLDDFAWRGPELITPGIDHYIQGTPELPIHWAKDRGLVWRIDWGRGHMPREVALAVRGPGYRAPFTPAPPVLPTAPVDADTVAHEAAAAAARTLDRTTALVDGAARTPIPLLKSGGVGVREIRRIAKELSGTEDESRLYLEVAAIAGLISDLADSAGLAPTSRYDDWLSSAPDVRLRVLLSAWWRMERCSIWESERGRPLPALGEWPYGSGCRSVRHAVLGMLAELPSGRGCRDADVMARAIGWRAPLLGGLELAPALPAALAEAALLGLTSDGSLSNLGRALVTSDEDLAEAASEALAQLRREALFGADLTAVVTGPPSPDLAWLLDLSGDRESQGAGTVWRFSPESVRRALDAGVDDLVSRLEAVASSGLPQPLIYLVRDVARRHGEIAVVSVSAVIRSDDPTLIKEIAANKRLAKLGLQVIAPTVLISRSSADLVLTALRSAGYGPVPALPDGSLVIQRGHRVAGGPPSPHRGDHAELIHSPDPAVAHGLDPASHARRLLAAEPAPAAAAPTWSTLRRRASHLPPSASSLLGLLIEHDIPARIRLEDETELLVSHGELDDGVLEAWSHHSEAYERFRLTDITAVDSP